jgi:hypothetical protein
MQAPGVHKVNLYDVGNDTHFICIGCRLYAAFGEF